MKVNTTTETVIKLADGLDAGRGVMGPSPLAAVLRALVGERDADRKALDTLIPAAISTAGFIESEYKEANEDNDIIPVSSPAYKVHERLWGAIIAADLGPAMEARR